MREKRRAPRWLAEMKAKLDQGDEYLDADKFTKAIDCYRQALLLLPEPKHGHEISLLAFTALGEAYFFSGWYQKALRAFRQAEKAPGGVENPLLHLRMGQASFEEGDFDRTADSLSRAYALDGRAIFRGEDKKYLSFLATRIEL
jgi:tetratricopeptide (TPR) repeat protein